MQKKTEMMEKTKKKQIKLENEYEAVVDQIRMKDAMIDELEKKVEDIVEKITIIEMEKQLTLEKNEVEKQRLIMELSDAKDALYAKNVKSKKE